MLGCRFVIFLSLEIFNFRLNSMNSIHQGLWFNHRISGLITSVFLTYSVVLNC